MTYFILQNHKGEKIGGRFYMTQSVASAVAKRTAGKWRKNSNLRGSAIKILQIDGSIYGNKVVEWVAA